MIENPEFWALLISILGGDFAIFWMNLQLKNEISEVRQSNIILRTDMEMEFAKCRLHECSSNFNNIGVNKHGK